MCKNKYPNRMVRNSHFINSGTLWNPQGNTNYEDATCIILGNLLRSSRLCSYPSQNTQNFKKDCTPRISDYMWLQKTKLMFIKWIPKTKYSNRLVRNHHFINSGTPLEPARKNQLRRRKSPASSLETCSAAVACAASPPGKTRNVFLNLPCPSASGLTATMSQNYWLRKQSWCL